MFLLARKHVVCWVWHWERVRIVKPRLPTILFNGQMRGSMWSAQYDIESECACATISCSSTVRRSRSRRVLWKPVATTTTLFCHISFTFFHILSHFVKVQIVRWQSVVVVWATGWSVVGTVTTKCHAVTFGQILSLVISHFVLFGWKLIWWQSVKGRSSGMWHLWHCD